MSRSAGLAMMMIIMLASTSAHAQEPSANTPRQVFEAAEKVYGPPPPKPACAEQEGEEIVVCAQEQDDSLYRVQSSSQLDPTSKEAVKDGVPRAPDVAGPGIFTGPATVGNLCIPGLQSCPPPPALLIDFTALPDTPEGSDADKVGKGELPTR